MLYQIKNMSNKYVFKRLLTARHNPQKIIDIFKIRSFTNDDVRTCFHALKSAILGIPIKQLLTRKSRIKSEIANKPLLSDCSLPFHHLDNNVVFGQIR